MGLLAVWPALALAAAPEAGPREGERVVDADHFDPGLLAREIFHATNEVRRQQGVAPCKPEPRLAAAAEGQAAMLAMRIHSGHDSPLTNQGDPFARVRSRGLPEGTVAENAATLNARNQSAGRDYTYRELAGVIVQAWMDSPGHRANLLDPALHYLGCGTRVAVLLPGQPVVYAIQDFYTPAPRPEPPPPSVRPGATSITR